MRIQQVHKAIAVFRLQQVGHLVNDHVFQQVFGLFHQLGVQPVLLLVQCLDALLRITERDLFGPVKLVGTEGFLVHRMHCFVRIVVLTLKSLVYQATSLPSKASHRAALNQCGATSVFMTSSQPSVTSASHTLSSPELSKT